MVATQGRGWRLAASLVALFDQADARWPHRVKIADGSIGDLAHSQRLSDHNPSGGFVHAADITHDPPVFDAYAFARQLASRRDPRVRYVISHGEIWKASTGRWEPYRGSNRHDHHTHVSIYHDQQARQDTSPWFPTAPPEDDLTADEHAMLASLVKKIDAVRGGVEGGDGFTSLKFLDDRLKQHEDAVVQRVVAALKKP